MIALDLIVESRRSIPICIVMLDSTTAKDLVGRMSRLMKAHWSSKATTRSQAAQCHSTQCRKISHIIQSPIVLLGRLAVDQSTQGRGLGARLLIDALRRAQLVADQLGIYAVAVEAINDRAQHFYLKFGFKPLRDDRLHLYLPLKVIRKLNL